MSKDFETGPDRPKNTSDDEAVREYGRQRAIDALMRDAIQNQQVPKTDSIAAQAKRPPVLLYLCAAAASIAALVGITLWKPAPAIPEAASVKLDARWKIESAADADYTVENPNLIKLRSGELQLTALQPAPLVVETPFAVATADNTHFLISHHPKIDNQPTKQMNLTKHMTRLFVLAGIVTVTNTTGTIQAAEDDAVVVAGTKIAPEKIAVKANSEFAIDLYTRLASENTGENIFFSPYSISTALMMTMEGARGQTANEMGQVLGFPEDLRRVGNDAQKIPWETSKLHSGLTSLNRLFNRGPKSQKQAALLQQVEELKEKLAEKKLQSENLRKKNKRKAYSNSRNEERLISIEIGAAQQKIDTIELEVANALWGEKTYPFLDSYVDTIRDAYDVDSLQMADFKNDFETERQRINQWVEGKTKERIKELVTEDSISADTRLVLLNAIYFKGNWAIPFDSKRTKDGTFSLLGGKTTSVPLMHNMSLSGGRYAAFNADDSLFDTPKMVTRGESIPTYPGKDGFSMVELPYQGQEVSMIVIAPNHADGLGAIESKLSPDRISGWIAQMKDRTIRLTLPKFRSETTYNLNDTLSAMGMPTAFSDPRSPKGADFSGISHSPTPSEKLYISAVVHKAFVDVNEEGTEAAAATAVMIGRASAPITRPFVPHFNADRPFIYLIRDNQTGSILFLGRMMNPQG